MSSTLAPSVFTLAGVALGVVGTLGAQYLATRESRRAAKATAKEALRQERKAAVLAFLDVCQRAENAAEDRAFGREQRAGPGWSISRSPRKPVLPDLDALKQDLWYRQKCIELVAGEDVQSAAFDYAKRLTAALFDAAPTGTKIFGFISDKRLPFIDAARAELKIPSGRRWRLRIPKLQEQREDNR
jgi:hypothetical protein